MRTNFFSVPFSVYFWLDGWVSTAFHKKHRGLQLIKISSEGDWPLISAGLLSLIRDIGLKKLRRSKWSLIRPNCVRKHFWSDPICARTIYDQTQVHSNGLPIRPNCARTVSDQTQVRSNMPMTRFFRPNWLLTRPTPDHGPDWSALKLPSRPCNFDLGTHACALDWFWS